MASQQISEIQFMQELFQELQKETDRASAVLSASYLDSLLARLLAAKATVGEEYVHKHLYRSGHGPLGPFAAKIDVAYSFGFVDADQRYDLHQIREIRNAFAHQLIGLSFDSQSIADKSRSLKGAAVGEPPSAPRECFEKAAVRLMVAIAVKLQERAGEQPEQGENEDV